MTQPDLNAAREDLQFVRDVVKRHGPLPTPLHSRILWACYCLIGMVWLDWKPRSGSDFMLFGFMVVTLIDVALTSKVNDSQGRRNRGRDRRELLQTGAFVAAILTVWALMVRGHFSEGYGPGQVFLTLVGYHLMSCSLQQSETSQRWLTGGLVLGFAYLVGAILISFFPLGAWTALGIISAIVIGFDFDSTREGKVSPS